MMKISAAICDDEEKVLSYLKNQLSHALEMCDIISEIDCFSDGRLLLHSILVDQKKYQVIFLDIEMKELDGIETCRKIRAIHYDTIIVFVSNKEELVFQTFKVQPFRFIRKNHFLEELPGLAVDIEKELSAQKGIMLTLNEQYSNSVYTLNVYEIIYIEVIGKYCHIVTTTKRQQIRYSLTDLEQQLSSYGFLKPHRSYLVNYRYIYNITNNYLLLDDNTRIPISRNRIKEIRTQFMNAIRSK